MALGVAAPSMFGPAAAAGGGMSLGEMGMLASIIGAFGNSPRDPLGSQIGGALSQTGGMVTMAELMRSFTPGGHDKNPQETTDSNMEDRNRRMGRMRMGHPIGLDAQSSPFLPPPGGLMPLGMRG